MRGLLLHSPVASCSGRVARGEHHLTAGLVRVSHRKQSASPPNMRRANQQVAGTKAVAAPSESLIEHDQRDHESFMKDRADFLKEDLKHLFDDQGIDQSQYNDTVAFRDPITKYDSVKGYMFNISLLKKVFAPNFTMHDMKRTGEYEVTSRWTMIMQFTLNRYSPLQRWWDPQLIFTGVSIMGVNPKNGKFDRHIDLWDALKNNEFLSWEGVKHVASQMGSLTRTPDLPGPTYTILRKTKQYEIRRYEPFLVAEAAFGQESSLGRGGAQTDPTAKGSEAFRDLAGFLFGKNSKQEKMSMTTPVLTDTTGTMQFILPAGMQDRKSLPSPDSSSVRCKRNEGGLYAASIFSGRAESAACQKKVSDLRAAVEGDAVKIASDDWMLARYNDPSTRPIFRRNEVLVKVKDFDLWGAGCFKG